MYNLTDKIRITDDIRFRRVVDEGVIVRLDKSEVVVVNDVGIRFLELVDKGLTFGDILSQLEEEYDIDTSQLHKDISRYCQELIDSSIIKQH